MIISRPPGKTWSRARQVNTKCDTVQEIQKYSAQCRYAGTQCCKNERSGRDRLNPWIQAANDTRKKKNYQRVKTGLRSLVYLGVARNIYHSMASHFQHFQLISFKRNNVLLLSPVGLPSNLFFFLGEMFPSQFISYCICICICICICRNR